MLDQRIGSLYAEMIAARIAVRESMDSDDTDFEVRQKLVRYTNLLAEYRRALGDLKT